MDKGRPKRESEMRQWISAKIDRLMSMENITDL